VKYLLAERTDRVAKDFRMREVRRLCDTGNQTSVVTMRRDILTEDVAVRMFSRWRQHNFFRYMRQEFAFDHLPTTAVEKADPERSVPSPAVTGTLSRSNGAWTSCCLAVTCCPGCATLECEATTMASAIDILQERLPSGWRAEERDPPNGQASGLLVVGLEGALVDVDRMKLGALTEGDDRVLEVKIAGPAALLVAKLLKIRDRRETTRHSDKDALDVARLLRGVETADLAERMRRLLADARSEAVTREALDLLKVLFGRRAAEGIEMAIRSAGGMVDADELAVSCEVLARDLLLSLGPRS